MQKLSFPIEIHVMLFIAYLGILSSDDKSLMETRPTLREVKKALGTNGQKLKYAASIKKGGMIEGPISKIE